MVCSHGGVFFSLEKGGDGFSAFWLRSSVKRKEMADACYNMDGPERLREISQSPKDT